MIALALKNPKKKKRNRKLKAINKRNFVHFFFESEVFVAFLNSLNQI